MCKVIVGESERKKALGRYKRGWEDNIKISLKNIEISYLNPLNAELNPICHLLALLGGHHILHVSRIRLKRRVKSHLPFAGIISSPYSPR